MTTKRGRPATKVVDWAAVETEWKEGVLSPYAIGDKHGVSEGYIRKKAKKENWPDRDLGAKIAARRKKLVQEELVRNEERTNLVPTDEQIIHGVAKVTARIRTSHQREIERYRKLLLTMLEELEAAAGGLAEFKEWTKRLGNGEDAQVILEAVKKTQTLPNRIDAVKKLSDVLKTLITLERQAYGIKDDEESAPPPAVDTNALEAARRVAFMLAQGARKSA